MVAVRWFAGVLLSISIGTQAQTVQSPADLMHAALAAMGGEEKVRQLTAFHFESFAIRNELEESERPEGPYIIENDQVEE